MNGGARKPWRLPDQIYAGIVKRKKRQEIPLHLRLVKGNVCPGRDIPFPSLGIREEILGFFLVGFSVGIILFCRFLFCMDAKEAVYRVFPALTEIILFVLTFIASGDLRREKMGEVDPPEVGIDLPLFEEFFYVPWRILHGTTSLFRADFFFCLRQDIMVRTYCTMAIFISISKARCRGSGLPEIRLRHLRYRSGKSEVRPGFFGCYRFFKKILRCRNHCGIT
jgi:hypothetical protein